MRYERAYYYDATARHGCCPADEALKIHSGFTPEVERLAVKLAAIAPYELAATLLGELASIHLSPSRLWQMVQQAGVQANQCLAQQAEQACALPDPNQISSGIAKTALQLATSLDGAMLNIRQEGWKEAKIGCAFEFKPKSAAKSTARSAARPTAKSTAGANAEQVQAQRISYVFHLGPPESFGQHLNAHLQQRQWETASRTAVLGDGAAWIWNLAERYCFTSTHIVDWYHAKQHLWSAAHLIAPHPDVRPDVHPEAWVEQMEALLFAGRALDVSAAIRAASPRASPTAGASGASGASGDLLEREAHYFSHNAPRMDYRRFRQQHFPIGSGTVESAAKQFKGRFTQAGMRWSRQGAVNLMPFRAAALSHDFDAFWRSVCP